MNGQIRQHQSIWPKQRTNPFAVGIVLALLVSLLVVALLVLIFGWGWTGFGPESSEPKQHAKTLWDWLQLLIIPGVLVVGGFSLNLIQKRREDETAQRRKVLEDEAAQRQRKLDTPMDFMRRVRAMHVTIKNAEDFLNAHNSGKTYVEQMKNLMRLQTDVEEISEDLKASSQLFKEQQEIINGFEQIISYLDEARQEYIKHHKDVDSDARLQKALDETIKDKKMDWVKDFMAEGEKYKENMSII